MPQIMPILNRSDGNDAAPCSRVIPIIPLKRLGGFPRDLGAEQAEGSDPGAALNRRDTGVASLVCDL